MAVTPPAASVGNDSLITCRRVSPIVHFSASGFSASSRIQNSASSSPSWPRACTAGSSRSAPFTSTGSRTVSTRFSVPDHIATSDSSLEDPPRKLSSIPARPPMAPDAGTVSAVCPEVFSSASPAAENPRAVLPGNTTLLSLENRWRYSCEVSRSSRRTVRPPLALRIPGVVAGGRGQISAGSLPRGRQTGCPRPAVRERLLSTFSCTSRSVVLVMVLIDS